MLHAICLSYLTAQFLPIVQPVIKLVSIIVIMGLLPMMKDVSREILGLITSNLLLGLNKKVFRPKIFRTKVRILICRWIVKFFDFPSFEK